ncbi:MAG: iron ABC transporter permease [Bdellovibrionaceae bacterium]|nr:iron ABC transporter permease [Pseudobdellovibrionaceae bacterium]
MAISPLQVISILLKGLGLSPLTDFTPQQEAVLLALRLPRVILGMLVGASLAVSGAAMQGLFRNPLASPSLLGVSSGASLAVACVVVMGVNIFGIYTLPIAAFIGSVITIALIYMLAQHNGTTNIATMLLAGIAINALCTSGTGLFTYLSTDEQLRTITFWQLGSLAGATWSSILSVSPLILLSIFLIPFWSNALNALLLGENAAKHLGVSVETVKCILVVLVGMGVGASVAVAGMIGFVGLVVPHLIRLWLGPNHKTLLPATALLGATLLVLADLFSRTVVTPSELPIGIVTSLTGAPFFLYLLLKNRRLGGGI